MADFEEFLKANPMFAQYFNDIAAIDHLEYPQVPDNAPIYDNWEKPAKRIINHIWKHPQAYIFHEPVDPEKLQILDYFFIIKKPMDMGTIKNRLNGGKYANAADFIDDVSLMFDNCILYNGETNPVSLMCKGVRDEYRKMYEQLHMNFYI